MTNSNSHGKDKLTVDYHEYESPTHAIVASIASLENTAVTDIDPLFNSIDTESLNQMLFHATNHDHPVAVETEIKSYQVTVQSDGTVTVRYTYHEYGTN